MQDIINTKYLSYIANDKQIQFLIEFCIKASDGVYKEFNNT